MEAGLDSLVEAIVDVLGAMVVGVHLCSEVTGRVVLEGVTIAQSIFDGGAATGGIIFVGGDIAASVGFTDDATGGIVACSNAIGISFNSTSQETGFQTNINDRLS